MQLGEKRERRELGTHLVHIYRTLSKDYALAERVTRTILHGPEAHARIIHGAQQHNSISKAVGASTMAHLYLSPGFLKR